MSPKFSLNTHDLEKVGEGALIVMAGALLTYAPEAFAKFDWGNAGPIATVLLSIAVNAGWKYVRGQEKSFDIPALPLPKAQEATELPTGVQTLTK